MRFGSKHLAVVAFVSGIALGTLAGIFLSQTYNLGTHQSQVGEQTSVAKASGLLDELVAAADAGKTFSPELIKLDWFDAAEYARSHPDHTSFHVLVALRQEFGGLYYGIPARTRAAILCAGMTRLRGFDRWGWIDETDAWDGSPAKALLESGSEAIPF